MVGRAGQSQVLGFKVGSSDEVFVSAGTSKGWGGAVRVLHLEPGLTFGGVWGGVHRHGQAGTRSRVCIDTCTLGGLETGPRLAEKNINSCMFQQTQSLSV